MKQSTSDPKLLFKPLSDGLGFHPFSDGLPYAPVGKTSQKPVAPSTGTGAVAAGPATYSPTIQRPAPIERAPRVSVPVAAPAPVLPRKETLAQPVRTEEPRMALPGQTFGILYMLKRCTAFVFDSVLNLGLCTASFVIALIKQDLSPDLLVSPGIIIPFAFFLIVFNWAIIAAQEVAFGTTVGKRLFSLTLNGSVSAIFLRAFFFLPSVGFCGLGLLWSVFDRRRRCWHDVVVDLQPTEIARL